MIVNYTFIDTKSIWIKSSFDLIAPNYQLQLQYSIFIFVLIGRWGKADGPSPGERNELKQSDLRGKNY